MPIISPQHQDPPASHGSERPKTTYKVLVTGFGPFIPTAPTNPSSAILPYLPSHLSLNKNNDSSPISINIRLQTHPHIKVSYSAVSALIPTLYAASSDEGYDFVIHVGMMSAGVARRGKKSNNNTKSTDTPLPLVRSEYHLETRARSGVYVKPDVEGLVPAPLSSGDDDEVEVLIPRGVDLDDVMRRWRREVETDGLGGKVDLGLSDDAGLFLCEFIYFSSLRYFERRGEDNGGADTKVVFLHIPAEAHRDDLCRAKEVVVGLVRALVGSCLVRSHMVENEEL